MKHKLFTLFIITLIAATAHATTLEPNTFQPKEQGVTSLLADDAKPSSLSIWNDRIAARTNAINLLASYRDEDNDEGKTSKKWRFAEDFKLRGDIEKIRKQYSQVSGKRILTRGATWLDNNN